MAVRVLVTGSRVLAARHLVWSALRAQYRRHGPLLVVHGQCPPRRARNGGYIGADYFADLWAREHAGDGCRYERHPADWRAGKQAGHWRNQYMVDLGAVVCLAFFEPGADNAGTSDCVRRAIAAEIPVLRFPEAA